MKNLSNKLKRIKEENFLELKKLIGIFMDDVGKYIQTHTRDHTNLDKEIVKINKRLKRLEQSER